jgi:methylated-DNA-[protein]-cysteine S-methyltransferase
MNAKPPETFGLDRLQTPIGPALLVTDAQGALLALEWEDYEPRLRQLLRLQHGAAVLKQARAPDDTRAALTGYFDGDLDAWADQMARRRHAVPAQGLDRATDNPVGTTTNYARWRRVSICPRRCGRSSRQRPNPISMWCPVIA